MADNIRERNEHTAALAAQLRAERASARLTQGELAAKAGIPRMTYIRLETHVRVADVAQIYRLADALGLSAAELMRRAAEREATPVGDN